MKFTLTIDTEGEAFQTNTHELSMLLVKVSDEIGFDPGITHMIYDHNHEICGHARWFEDDTPPRDATVMPGTKAECKVTTEVDHYENPISVERFTHVNTGCLYTKEGQKVTIVHAKDATHFIDHSRMVHGSMPGTGLSDIDVIKRYVMNDYDHLKLDTQRRMEIEKFEKTATFRDISAQYSYMMQMM
jgi:hypothetical protein